MARSVGLDIGSKTVKLAELSGSAKGFKVVRVLVRPVPPGTGEEGDAALTEMLRALFQEAKCPKDDVCVSFDAGTTIFREITVPFHEDAQIEKVVRFEAENHLHGRAIEDVVVNWVKTGTTREGSQLLVFASPKADLARRIGIVRAAGIEPASVDLDATALYSACETTGVFRDHPNVVVVEIGARTTNLLVVDGGQVKMIRSFHAGVESAGAALRGDLDVGPEEASARLLKPKGPDPDALLVPMGDVGPGPEAGKSLAAIEGEAAEGRRDDFTRKLRRELTRSLTAARGANPPEKILLAGGGSLLPGAADSLRTHFGLPVEPLDLLGRLGAKVEDGDASPQFLSAASAVAVGCGVRLLGVDPLHVELRRDEFAPTNTFDVVKGALAVVVTLLFCLLLALAYSAKLRLDAERIAFLGPKGVMEKARTIYEEAERKYQQHVLGRDEGQAKQEAQKQLRSLPQDANYVRAVKGRLDQRHRRLQGELGLSKDIPRIQSALEVWAEIYAALNTLERKSLGYVRINKLTVLQSNATLQVELESEAVVDRLEAAFKSSAYLKRRAKDPNRPLRGQVTKARDTGRTLVTFDFQFGEEQ